MSDERNKHPDVGGGFYTVREAARLLEISSPQKIARWLVQPPSGEPVIMRQYERIGPQSELSFLDLIEVRFVEHFRRQKISLQSLRIAARNARRELATSHPFALSNARFQTDRKQVFLESARESHDRIFLNLMTNQIEMYDVIEGIIAKDLQFDLSGLAVSWQPSVTHSPNVIVSPSFAFGRPVISSKRVPTIAIFKSWKAESGRFDVVADWFDIPVELVREAVEFEARLPA